ncbi:hypothetical protein NMG60_11006074 [Bertholletia excelsa]
MLNAVQKLTAWAAELFTTPRQLYSFHSEEMMGNWVTGRKDGVTYPENLFQEGC